MEYNVAQLLQAIVGDSRVYDISEDIGHLDGIPAIAPLTGQVRMVRMPDTILVEAKLRTEVVLNCSRCLDEVTYPLMVEFVEQYEPTVDISTGLPVHDVGDAQRFRIDGNHVLDLGEAVREYGLLVMPMQPICRVDCKGLCPRCGQNLNVATCNCSADNIDSRLVMLQKLLEDA